MVNTFASYVGKKHKFYSSDGFSTFSARIIAEKDSFGNIRYYRITKEKEEIPKERIFVNGKNRTVMVKGYFVKAKDRLSEKLCGRTMVKT